MFRSTQRFHGDGPYFQVNFSTANASLCIVFSLQVDNISLVGTLLTLFSKEALEVIHELKLYHTAKSTFPLPQNLFFEQMLH